MVFLFFHRNISISFLHETIFHSKKNKEETSFLQMNSGHLHQLVEDLPWNVKHSLNFYSASGGAPTFKEQAKIKTAF